MEISDILIKSDSFNEVLNKLMIYSKQKKQSFNSAYVSKYLDFKSSGHISDILNGRRRLAQKHWSKLASLFELNPLQSEIFILFLKIEREKDLGSLERLKQQKRELQALLEGPIVLKSEFNTVYKGSIALDVFTSLRLFDKPPSRNQIVDKLGKEHSLDIDRSLAALLREGILSKTDQRYHTAKTDRLLKLVVADKESELAFLKTRISESIQNIDNWYEKNEEAMFLSGTFSVNRKKYQKILEEFRFNVLKLTSEHGDEEIHDQLIRFNFQVYPYLKIEP